MNREQIFQFLLVKFLLKCQIMLNTKSTASVMAETSYRIIIFLNFANQLQTQLRVPLVYDCPHLLKTIKVFLGARGRGPFEMDFSMELQMGLSFESILSKADHHLIYKLSWLL